MLLKSLTALKLITVRPEDAIDTAIARMEEHGIRHLPVVRSDGVPVGMLSDRDILESVGWLSRLDRVDARAGSPSVGPQRVMEIMSVPSLGLQIDERVERAARLMLDKRFGAVPILSNGHVVGIVTETDLLRCYVADRNEPRGGWRFLHVTDQMHANVFTLRPVDLLGKAARLMHEKHIRHVPVVDGGTLAGMVSDRDVRRAIGRERIERNLDRVGLAPSEPTLAEIMSREVVTIPPDATLAEAADLMLTRKVGALPVMSRQSLIGIITETDLLHVLVAAFES